MTSAIDTRYQTFWPRFWAGWIDFIVWIPIMLVDSWIGEHVHAPVLLATWFVAYTFSYYLYSVAMHAKFGQTVGKMVTGVKVIDVSENILSLRQALLRDCVPIGLSILVVAGELPDILSGAARPNDAALSFWDDVEAFGSMFWFSAELVTMLMNSKRRAIHDFVAGSVVVRTRHAVAVV